VRATDERAGRCRTWTVGISLLPRLACKRRNSETGIHRVGTGRYAAHRLRTLRARNNDEETCESHMACFGRQWDGRRGRARGDMHGAFVLLMGMAGGDMEEMGWP
jgi:hypothetical protein